MKLQALTSSIRCKMRSADSAISSWVLSGVRSLSKTARLPLVLLSNLVPTSATSSPVDASVGSWLGSLQTSTVTGSEAYVQIVLVPSVFCAGFPAVCAIPGVSALGDCLNVTSSYSPRYSVADFDFR